MAKDLLDAVYGCVVGGAIGDALGAPVEGWHWKDIRAKYPGGRITEMEPGKRGNTGPLYGGTSGYSYGDQYDGPITPPGAVTDDTTLRHYLCYAIVQKGGRVTPDDYAKVWLEKMNPNRLWINERVTLWKLRMGMSPWETGKGNPPAGVASMSIAPIGIVNAGNPAQAYQDGFNIGFLNQDNVDRDGAATLAAAVAAAFIPGATYQSVIDVMLEHSSYIVKRSLMLTMDIVHESRDIDDFAEKFYAKMLDWKWPDLRWSKERNFSGSSVELVPITAAVLYMTKGDVNQGIIEAAALGRDNDTTAALVANIAGVIHGASAIRQDWIETVEQGNADFFKELEGDPNANFYSMAQRLVAVLKNEAQTAQERAAFLTTLVS